MTPTKVSYEVQYSDGSGVEIGVHFDTNKNWQINIEAGSDTVSIELKHLSFLRDALSEISKITDAMP